MKTRHLAALLAGALSVTPLALAQEGEADPTSATPAIQVENATKFWEQFVAAESAWDPATAALYSDDGVVDRTTLSAGSPDLKSFTGAEYKAVLPTVFEQAKAGGAVETWSNVKVLYDGPARTLVTADLAIAAGGNVSPTAKVQVIIFDMPDGPLLITSDQRTVDAPGFTPPTDESAPLVAKLDAALGALDSNAIAALFAPDGKVVMVEKSVDGDELGRHDMAVTDFPGDLENEFGPLREAKGSARFIVWESYKNEDGTWHVRGEAVSSAPDSHDFYNSWGDTLTLVQKDGNWTIGTWERAFQHDAH